MFRPYIILLFTAILVAGCSTTKKIKDGTTAFQQKQYAKAISMLRGEISGMDSGEEYARLAYLLGESYKNVNDSDNSLKWYIEAAKNDYGPEAYWEMAYALKKGERYEDAILSFQRLARFTDRKDEIRKEIEKCRQAMKLAQMESGETLIVRALPLNSPASDYAPALLGDDQIVFTSDRYGEDDDLVYEWTGNAFSDLYITDIYNYEPYPLEGANTPDNEGTATFNKTGDIMYFTRCASEIGDSYCHIYRSEWDGGQWTKGVLAFPIKPRVNYRDPVLIENDSVLIFVSDDPTGVGGSDLYYSFMLEDGTWDVPDLMPPYLNSIGEERFPTWDGEVLYYSSDHFTGLGGLDVFKTKLNQDGSWTQPQNMLPPINSSQDDYAYIKIPEPALLTNIKSKAFFTSTRGVFGNDDLYEAVEYYTEEELNEQTPPDTSAIVTEEEALKTFFLRVKVSEHLYAITDNPNSLKVGEKALANASVRINDEILVTDNNGYVVLPFDSLNIFNLTAGKQGYLNEKWNYQVPEEELENRPDRYVFEQEATLDKIYEGVEITLDNIYYDLDKSFIRDDAKPALNELIKLLSDNPGVSIQLGSHTDCQGLDEYNQGLSQRRAAAAVEYIVDEGGISKDRLSAVGYGETKLEIQCVCEECSEDEHQINRRTTFAIVN